MTHGGGTVAGESPEKAEQQESSQEATPGGGGRDPRLSVFRESSSSSASSASSVSRSSPSSASAGEASGSGSGAEAESESGAVRVDQPTAVFKTLTPRAPEDDAPAAEAPRTQTPEPKTPDAEPPAAEDGGEGGEDRLRAAVAAWVASGDEAATTDAEAADGAEGPETAVETVVDGEAVADEAGEPVAAEAEPEADADVTSEAPEAGEAPARAEAPEAGTDADAGPAKDWFASRKPGKAENPADAPAAEDAPAAVDEQPEAEPEADAAPAEPALDQPTAVFKAVRPPVVDQPTTALKLPPVTPVTPSAKPTPTDGAAPEAAKAPEAVKAPESAKAPSTPQAPKPPESDAERTSQFIPLRRDLPEAAAAPAPQRPAEPKPAAAAAPSAPAAATPPASLTEAERTRQQPMPPLPPLDLLAELTNTPPPQPTALRTTVRRVRIWTPLVILLLIIFAIVQFVRPLPAPALALSTAPTYTFAGGALNMPWPAEGQGAAEVEGVGSLGTYGAQKPAPIASVAKTMTAYVILRDHPIKGNANGPEITVDKKAGEQAKAKDESTAQIEEGQKYSEKELLQLLMIPSGNNVARLLARWDAGTEAAFVDKMNAAAKDLGMTGSVYTDPSGLQATTVSTPLDQLKLAKAVMQYDVFREIVNMPNLTVDGIPGQIENNNNILLKPGVGGIKTGSSTPAGGNLLWSANTVIDGKSRRILGVVMGAKDADQLYQKLQLAIDYSLKLIQQAQKDVTSAPVVRKGQVVGYVDDGLGGRTPVIATKELKAIGWPGLKVDLELTDGGTAVPHAAKAGAIVGQVSIGTGTGKVSAPVALQADLVEPGFDKKLTRIG
ncbi:D-alanyl-D-alanine carboxypeptidase family protein [Streptomyces sp. NPDC054861]